jgi:hypothetical protein
MTDAERVTAALIVFAAERPPPHELLAVERQKLAAELLAMCQVRAVLHASAKECAEQRASAHLRDMVAECDARISNGFDRLVRIVQAPGATAQAFTPEAETDGDPAAPPRH